MDLYVNEKDFSFGTKDPASMHAEVEDRKTEDLKQQIESYCIYSKDHELSWVVEPYKVEIEGINAETGSTEYQTYTGMLHTLRYVQRQDQWASDGVIYRQEPTMMDEMKYQPPQVFDIRENEDQEPIDEIFCDFGSDLSTEVDEVWVMDREVKAGYESSCDCPSENLNDDENVTIKELLAFIDANNGQV
ncbi:hypothetical protein BEWA_022780 [Theileria equi strain WA]|uniref:Uncharacterized protein n=1 Tax=Theileria equi strain WA TaxID=1537102 RepID=L0AV68_THEEQ|nr:hypothetical protein BEWA_022780 [Theileria equi strain WA]AFZ79430.1 hypothetical protein BEWA_022780 [Theileria equi strain WA]|eukprot:XP_004829096.1 hypothetical protein BEWA_022780 [Theileria equi strain WA]